MAAGISYSGWKNRADGLNLVDPILSKVLRDAVQKRSIVAQFATEILNEGTGKGNEYEIVMAADDPQTNLLDRTVQDDMDTLKTVDLSFAAHSYSSREYGNAIKYNEGDISLAEFNLEKHVRDYLGRDVARLRDTFSLQEMDLTPWRYIPFSETEGVTTTKSSYFYTGPRRAALGAAGYPLTSLGKILPVQYPFYNGVMNQLPATGCLVDQTVAYVTSPLYIGSALGGQLLVGPGPFADVNSNRLPVDLSKIDPASPNATLDPSLYPIPKMTHAHLSNMICYALSLNLLPFEKLRWGSDIVEGFVLLLPSIQAANLIRSLNWLSSPTNIGGFAPATIEELRKIPMVSGATFMCPGLPVPCMVVVDNYNLGKQLDIYAHGYTEDQTAVEFTDRMAEWATLSRTMWGGVITSAYAGVQDAPMNTLSLTEAACRQFVANNITLGWEYWMMKWLPLGYGPAYLLGKDVVQELVNQSWQIRKMDKQDFARIGGWGWVMRAGWKNPWCPNTAATTKGMPFNLAYNPASDNVFPSAIEPFYLRNQIVKFDWPTWVQPGEPPGGMGRQRGVDSVRKRANKHKDKRSEG